MTFPGPLIAKAEELLEAYRRAGLKIATAESCTGGLIAGCLTEIPGASDVVERGFLTYSNQAKHDLLGVPMEMIRAQGAVSAEVAEAMAAGAPVVCSTAASLPEVAADAACMVDANDVEALREAIRQVVEDPERAGELRERGLRRASAMDWESSARALRELYGSLL